MPKVLWIILAATALPLAACNAMGVTSGNPLHAEAEKIFTYDREHPNRLPAYKLRRLSLALEFYDDAGAQALIHELETDR